MTTGIFDEIIFETDKATESESAYTNAFIAVVEPKQCATLIRRLSSLLPLDTLEHLKRVRKGHSSTVTAGNGPAAKRHKSETVLEVLLGQEGTVRSRYKRIHDHESSLRDVLRSELSVIEVKLLQVPAQPPKSEAEWKAYCNVWPTVFFPKCSEEYLESLRLLSEEELTQMHEGIQKALEDSNKGEGFPGCVILSPLSGEVLARASDERAQQGPLTARNPLATSVILAIQGISRREREHATQQGMDSPDFQKGQYICTGLDVYCTHEPTAFEAMALVHSRIRRLVFGCAIENGGITLSKIHCLPGTNHNYRAFSICKDTKLWDDCLKCNKY